MNTATYPMQTFESLLHPDGRTLIVRSIQLGTPTENALADLRRDMDEVLEMLHRVERDRLLADLDRLTAEWDRRHT